MADPESDLVYNCDCCEVETDEPVSVNVPVGGGGTGLLDFCPECASMKMQMMLDRLGVEFGSRFVMEVKSEAAKRSLREGRVKGVEEEDGED